MKLSISSDNLALYLEKQLINFFPDGSKINIVDYKKIFNDALQRTEFCFSKIKNKYFFNGKTSVFNHLNSDQYCMFLYFLSNTFYKANVDLNLCTKIFLLNKCFHGIDVFYDVELPDIFLFVHPIGTVLGRGKYSNYFLVHQGCCIGNNKDIYPCIGEYVSLYTNSSVFGSSNIGRNCKLSAYSYLIDMDLNENSLYIGSPREHSIKISEQVHEIWC